MDGNGLFFATYDYGYGNELIPYLNEQAKTVWACIILGFIMIWILSMVAASFKDEVTRVYTSFGYLALACLAITGFFGFCFWDTAIATIVLVGGIIIGIELCILGDTLDDYREELDEREERKYRRKLIREYEKKQKRGR